MFISKICLSIFLLNINSTLFNHIPHSGLTHRTKRCRAADKLPSVEDWESMLSNQSVISTDSADEMPAFRNASNPPVFSNTVIRFTYSVRMDKKSQLTLSHLPTVLAGFHLLYEVRSSLSCFLLLILFRNSRIRILFFLFLPFLVSCASLVISYQMSVDERNQWRSDRISICYLERLTYEASLDRSLWRWFSRHFVSQAQRS